MSDSTSIEEISQPGRSHYEKMVALQKERKLGLYVQCDDCNRWRYLPNILDRHQLSKKWYCRMNPDRSAASCSEPEIPMPYSELEEVVHGEYSAGSLVAARLPGWPWWPAMVDDCPDTEQYYWLDGFSDIPTHYNVVFFDAQDATRAWLAPNQLKPYAEGQSLLQKSLQNKTYHKRLTAAIKNADDAELLPLHERLAKYSFITKYRGNILTPRKISKKEAKKYKESFKRKYKVDLPSDSEDDIALSEHGRNEKESKRVENSIETNTDIIDTLIKSVSANLDANNNIEMLKDSSTAGSLADKLLDQPILTPPSDDFDFKM